MNLNDYGWTDFRQKLGHEAPPDEHPYGRVLSEYRGQYKIVTRHGIVPAGISGKMRYKALRREDFPAVGDWLQIQEQPGDSRAMIHRLLPRFSHFSRKMAGLTTDEQIVAANIDTVFLVMALNHDFNLRRLERYMTMAWESGANPVIVLSKVDLCPNIAEKQAEVEAIAFGVPVLPVCAMQNSGREALMQYLTPGQTAAFLGSSGAGKSTLTNWLCGEELQAVHVVRENDARGRHTTTNRELILLTDGGTPPACVNCSYGRHRKNRSAIVFLISKHSPGAASSAIVRIKRSQDVRFKRRWSKEPWSTDVGRAI